MQLRILGKYGPYPAGDGDVTGYYLSFEGTDILLDLGNGSFNNYLKYRSIHDLTAVIFSHLHDDHTGDMPSLKFALQYNKHDIDAYAPDTPKAEYDRIAAVRHINMHPVDANTTLKIGGMEISFCEVAHPVTTYAAKIKAGGKVFVYSGDTYYVPQFEAFCAGADFVLCEAGILDHETDKKDKHMSVIEGCEMARRAGVKKIVFAHLFPGHPLAEYEKERALFPDVDSELASEDKIYEI